MLRTSFPVGVSSPDATCEIQFGSIERPTHRNTSWDLAKDEVAAQKWVDLSQGDYGVALVNDSKYGHKVKDNTLDLNLLRSVPYTGERVFDDSQLKPGQPNYVYGDQEDHEFRYGLYPHTGDHVTGEVARAAWEFNLPLRATPLRPRRGKSSAALALVSVDADAVIVESVKLAEDRDSVIVRMYESAGCAGRAQVRFERPVRRVREVDLMEKPIKDLGVTKNGVSLRFKPFQIRTLEIQFEQRIVS